MMSSKMTEEVSRHLVTSLKMASAVLLKYVASFMLNQECNKS